MSRKLSTDEVLAKYGRKLESEIGEQAVDVPTVENFSADYLQFRDEVVPELNRYERWAKSLGNLIKIKVALKDRVKIQKELDAARLDVTPSQTATLALVAMLGIFFATILFAVAFYLINGSLQLLLVFLGLVTSVFVFYYAITMPKRLASVWRLRASSEMVPAILYVVVYMKHTSNLERAIAFAAQHLEGPLALDMKKIFYDVEVGKYSTIKQSLDEYLESWKEYAPEFVESFHLVESSLFEPAEARRIEILEKSLQVILDGVYEKMLKYSREIRSPLTNIYMLGIILPTLGLALLPLASTLLGGILQWPHVFVLFNILIPFFVFYVVSEILLKRPGGYGETTNLELNPDYSSYKSKRPWIIAALIVIPLLILGFLPFIMQLDWLVNGLGLQSDYSLADFGIDVFGPINLFDFKATDTGGSIGPFGPLAVFLSLFIPFGIALFFSVAYGRKTKKLISSRKNTDKLEEEFANSLFQLGNRIGDGTPAEIAMGKIAESTKGQMSSEFFAHVNHNIQQMGMSLESAVFDKRRGAIVYYPSALIATSMRILVESVKKGLKVAARSLMSISDYVKNIRKINYRLKDLLAEIITDMKSNMTFLAPLLAGIVVGLSAMITFILNKLELLTLGGDTGLGGLGSFADIASLFDVKTMIPPYFIQIAVGIYIIEIIFILTGALVTVDSGKDALREKYELARNLKRGVLLYLITSLVSIVALLFLAGIALGGLGV